MSDDVDLTLVTLTFDASDAERLVAVLAKYVVISRGQPGCRNIDLAASATIPGRFVVIEKWDSPEAQRDHFDSAAMVDMARSCEGLLTGPPQSIFSTRSAPTTSTDGQDPARPTSAVRRDGSGAHRGGVVGQPGRRPPR